MEVYKVGKSVLRGWMRATSIRDTARNRFQNHRSTLTSEENYRSGCYAVVEMDTKIGDPVFYQFEYAYFFRSMAAAQSYAAELIDDNRYTSYPLHVEIWQIVDDSQYYYDDDSQYYYDDDTYFTQSDEWITSLSPKQFQVAFADMYDVVNYVCTAIGDEYVNDFDVFAIARAIVDYDATRGFFFLKPAYRGDHVNQITNNYFWQVVSVYDKRRDHVNRYF